MTALVASHLVEKGSGGEKSDSSPPRLLFFAFRCTGMAPPSAAPANVPQALLLHINRRRLENIASGGGADWHRQKQIKCYRGRPLDVSFAISCSRTHAPSMIGLPGLRLAMTDLDRTRTHRSCTPTTLMLPEGVKACVHRLLEHPSFDVHATAMWWVCHPHNGVMLSVLATMTTRYSSIRQYNVQATRSSMEHTKAFFPYAVSLSQTYGIVPSI